MTDTDTSYFPIRGLIEGFYGSYYTFPERDDLIRFSGRHGYNLYIYGPKNDRQHRIRWWEPYPARTMARFGRTVEVAREAGVMFCYAISFGVPIAYASEDDFRIVAAKLRAFYDLGVRSFAVLMDDTASGLAHEVNRAHYRGVVEAHADLCNRLYAWLQTLGEPCALRLCQAEYHGIAGDVRDVRDVRDAGGAEDVPFSRHLSDLGAQLHPDIDLFYSGRAICAPTITVEDIRAFTATAGRAPLIWDNYPVNDLEMRREMHLGPLRGRDPALHRVVKGVVVNPMVQPEASKIPLLTYADYLRDPDAYDPERSWDAALREIAGEDSARELRLFAENWLCSCVDAPGGAPLKRRADAALAELRAGAPASSSAAVRALEAYFVDIDESGYHLKNHMENLALRQNILPWVETLEDWMWMGRRALTALRAIEAGAPNDVSVRIVKRSLDDLRRNMYRSGGEALAPLAEHVLACAGHDDRRDAARGPDIDLPSPSETANEAFTTAPPGSQGVSA